MGDSKRFRELTEVLRLVAHPIQHPLAGELCELLRRVALRRLGNYDVDAEDILHDLIVAKLHRLVHAASVAYAAQALRNEACSRLRRRRRTVSLADEPEGDEDDRHRPKVVADAHKPVDEKLADLEEALRLLGRLAPKDAHFLERVLAGEAREELAAELGVKRSAIDKRYSRILESLRSEPVR